MMINPYEANLVKNPMSMAVAPNGSAIERSFVANSKNGEYLQAPHSGKVF